MPHGGHPSMPAPPHPPATNTSTPASSDSVQSKRDLNSWWKNFKRGNPTKSQEDKASQGIFGVPLQTSIRYANVAISLFNEEGKSYIYGYVPIVVAKCGVFLKEKATDVEGIFRLSGSEKRIKELRIAFDSPDRYGKGLDWGGYTVHDAANILRRYFNQLPEPIIPLDFYQRFREPLKNHQAQAVGSMDLQGPVIGSFDPGQAIRVYQGLITELPPLNRQLLLYILDLLAVFASKSDLNKMTTPNLAAIFQPGLLSHPQHDMAPAEYRLSQDVLIFLIENQDSFLIGMHGTAADEKTVQEVQSGAPTPKLPASPGTPGRSKTLLGRSASNASAGADSIRRFGGLRRNVSVSSRGSKHSGHVQGQATPTLGSPTNSGGVHRSNTVPSKRSAASPRFPRNKSSEPPTPSPGSGPLPPTVNTLTGASYRLSEEITPVSPEAPADDYVHSAVAPVAVDAAAHPMLPAHPEIISASSSETTTPLATHGSETTGLLQREHTYSSTAPLAASVPSGERRTKPAERSPSGTPSRAILNLLKPSPGGSEAERRDGRKPNKLQKKRIPGSALSSAHSSAHSLQQDPESMNDYFASPVTPSLDSRAFEHLNEPALDRSAYATAVSSPRFMTPQRTETDTTLRPTVSPAHSYRSHTSNTDVTDASDADYADNRQSSTEKPEKKRRWRFSHPAKSREGDSPIRSKTTNFGSTSGSDQSKSTMSSSAVGGGGAPRASFQDTHVMSDPESVLSDSDDRKKGPMSWIRGKLADRKERDTEKRPRSPVKVLREEHNNSRQSLTDRLRGKSLEVSRPRSPAPPRVTSMVGAGAVVDATQIPSDAATHVVAPTHAVKQDTPAAEYLQSAVTSEAHQPPTSHGPVEPTPQVSEVPANHATETGIAISTPDETQHQVTASNTQT